MRSQIEVLKDLERALSAARTEARFVTLPFGDAVRHQIGQLINAVSQTLEVIENPEGGN